MATDDIRGLVVVLRTMVERRNPQERNASVLSRLVFQRLRGARGQYNLQGEYRSVLKEPVEGVAYIELILKWDPDIEPHVPAREPWVHHGQVGKTRDGRAAIRLTYRLAHSFIEEWMLEALSHDVAGVIRHELEHTVQPPGGGAPKHSGPRNWADLDATRAYLLNPKEIEAWATQAYLEAKRKREPVTGPVGRKVERLEKALRRRDVPKQMIQALADDLRKAVTDYMVRRYPTARFRIRSGEVIPAANLRSPWW